MVTHAENINARLLLFAPGDSERKMEKATAGAADIVILDLEDAVAEATKPSRRVDGSALGGLGGERETSRKALGPDQSNPRASCPRDLAAVMPAAPAGIMFPKPRGRADAELLDHYLTGSRRPRGLNRRHQSDAPVTEMPESMLAIGSYAGVPRVVANVMGRRSLATRARATDNRGDYGGYDFTYELARSLCLVGAAAAGVPAIERSTAISETKQACTKRATQNAARRLPRHAGDSSGANRL